MDTILECSKRTISKIAKRMNLSCFNCGWNLCVCDFHHILPQSKGGGDELSNLTYLCPNCHRAAHNGLISEFKSAKEVFGDTWKEYYNVTPRTKSKRDFEGKVEFTNEMKAALELGRAKRSNLAEDRARTKLLDLKNANLDTAQYGWIQQASKILQVAPQSVVRYLNRHSPGYLVGAKLRRSKVKSLK